jgi:hypothetical protein
MQQRYPQLLSIMRSEAAVATIVQVPIFATCSKNGLGSHSNNNLGSWGLRSYYEHRDRQIDREAGRQRRPGPYDVLSIYSMQNINNTARGGKRTPVSLPAVSQSTNSAIQATLRVSIPLTGTHNEELFPCTQSDWYRWPSVVQIQ